MPWTDLDRYPGEPDVRAGLELMGAAVARRRRQLRMSQRELARRSGVHQSSISRFERGLQFCIRWSRFARLVVVLGGLDFDLDRRDADRPPPPPSWAQLRAASLAEWLAEWRATEEAIRGDQDEQHADDAAAEKGAAGGDADDADDVLGTAGSDSDEDDEDGKIGDGAEAETGAAGDDADDDEDAVGIGAAGGDADDRDEDGANGEDRP